MRVRTRSPDLYSAAPGIGGDLSNELLTDALSRARSVYLGVIDRYLPFPRVEILDARHTLASLLKTKLAPLSVIILPELHNQFRLAGKSCVQSAYELSSKAL
jgi:hypothetical protein